MYKPLKPYGYEAVILDLIGTPGYEAEILTDIEPPVPNWKLEFDYAKKEWVELATDEEKKPLANPVPISSSDLILASLTKKVLYLEQKAEGM